MKPENLQIYFNWSCRAIVGSDPVGADKYLKENLETIRYTAARLFENLTPNTIYRGVILENPVTELAPHENFTYLSFSEDKNAAMAFADPTEKGFGSVQHLGDFGYLIEYLPKVDEILWHHSLITLLPYIKEIGKMGVDARSLPKQKEVIIMQPAEPFKQIFPFTDLPEYVNELGTLKDHKRANDDLQDPETKYYKDYATYLERHTYDDDTSYEGNYNNYDDGED